MNSSFPCKITYSDEHNCWHVESPGFYDGILTFGETLEDAKKMAAEAISGLVESHIEHGDNFVIPDLRESRGWYDIPLETEYDWTMRLHAQKKKRRLNPLQSV
ncbi:MAG: type II toxin-antitoxin system HicB family antitoxin [Spirochaetaceae bacterium]|jgi:predicted RNase H-like HicB family nuclease|nr:type II toxin-antitoxin system HicB family antitoxin [Spirochaetaceae bacterium]